MHWLLASSSTYRAALLSKLNIKFEQYSPDIPEQCQSGENALLLSLRLSLQKALKAAENNKDVNIIASDQTAQVVGASKIQNKSLNCLTSDCLGIDDKILSKPFTFENAFKQLSQLNNNVAIFLTGLCVLCPVANLNANDVKTRIEHLPFYSTKEAIDVINNLKTNTNLNLEKEFLIYSTAQEDRLKTSYYCQLLVEPFLVHFRELTTDDIKNYISLEQPFDCAGSFKSEGLGISLFKKMEGDDANSLIGLPLIRLISCLNKVGYNVLAN